MKEVKISDFDSFLSENKEITKVETTNPIEEINQGVEQSNNILNGLNTLLSNINNLINNPIVNNIIAKKYPELQQQPQQQVNKLQVLQEIVNNLPENITIKELKKELQQPNFRDNFK